MFDARQNNRKNCTGYHFKISNAGHLEARQDKSVWIDHVVVQFQARVLVVTLNQVDASSQIEIEETAPFRNGRKVSTNENVTSTVWNINSFLQR